MRNQLRSYGRLVFVWMSLGAALVGSHSAAAGIFELSVGFNYNKTTYSDENNYEWTRKWGASFGYHLTEMSEIELSFQDVFDKTVIVGFQDTTFHDEIYSINWVQALTGKNSSFQPYFKVGVGQLNRDATGSYTFGVSPPTQEDSVTGILGAGLKIFLTRSFGLRGEATTYLTGGSISTWQDNIAVMLGTSFYF